VDRAGGVGRLLRRGHAGVLAWLSPPIVGQLAIVAGVVGLVGYFVVSVVQYLRSVWHLWE
jgi:hypothetical protein